MDRGLDLDSPIDVPEQWIQFMDDNVKAGKFKRYATLSISKVVVHLSSTTTKNRYYWNILLWNQLLVWLDSHVRDPN